MKHVLELDTLNIDEALEALTRQAINLANGNVTEACRQLRCSKATFYRYASKYMISVDIIRSQTTCYIENNGAPSVADLNLRSTNMYDINKRRKQVG